MDTAKLFVNGRNQAVRLPKEFAFSGDSVQIKKVDGMVMLIFKGAESVLRSATGETPKSSTAPGRTIASRETQSTIQGQTISPKYWTRVVPRFNIEQLVTAGLDTNVSPEPRSYLSHDDITLMDEVSRRAEAAYRALKDSPEFLGYLKGRTPLIYHGTTTIASRPSQRGPEREISLDRLRAIPFVGAWSQVRRNVPGYYGFGSALVGLQKEGRLSNLRKL